MRTHAYDTLIDAVAAIDRVGWDTPFRISDEGMVTTPEYDNVHMPDSIEYDGQVLLEFDSDVLIDGGMSEWTALAGLTRQHGYRGAVMHPSEVMSPDIVEAMLTAQDEDDPQVWALVTVRAVCDEDCDDECETDHGDAGWAIVHADDPTVRLYEHQAEEQFADHVNGTHPTVTLCGITYDPGRLFQMADPVAFRQEMLNWADAMGIEIR